jgi:SAM-dependent methyltransferase
MINPSEIANIARTEETLWWFRGMRAISFGLLDALVRQARPRQVLEAGCGTGHFAGAFRERYGVDVTALDLEPEAVRYCRRRPGLRPVRGSVTALPFCNAAFDLVACLDVLPHFPPGDERLPFSELVRVVRPGGFLLLRAAALRVFRSRHSEFVWERQRFTRRQLAQLARAGGLRVRRLTYANFLLTPVAFAKFRVWEPLTRQPPASGLAPPPAWLDTLLYTPLALENSWISRGGSFPWGQSLILLAEKPEKGPNL